MISMEEVHGYLLVRHSMVEIGPECKISSIADMRVSALPCSSPPSRLDVVHGGSGGQFDTEEYELGSPGTGLTDLFHPSYQYLLFCAQAHQHCQIRALGVTFSAKRLKASRKH